MDPLRLYYSSFISYKLLLLRIIKIKDYLDEILLKIKDYIIFNEVRWEYRVIWLNWFISYLLSWIVLIV
jgi:hypothetical protein